MVSFEGTLFCVLDICICTALLHLERGCFGYWGSVPFKNKTGSKNGK
jgi:hypothetical protein